MTDAGGTEQIGALIRQLRRQRNITQTALGASRYSKSYVSGVEKNIIRPSPKALEFFAEQLGQPPDYFSALLKNQESTKQALREAPENGEPSILDEGSLLLRLLQERTDPHVRALEALWPLSPEQIAALSPSEQGSYFLLEGLITQERQEYDAALGALERALPLVSAQLQPSVLDALGQHHFLRRSYSIALYYHQRALALLRHASAQEQEPALLFPVALHCGEDYRALGAYSRASEMYDLARTHLHDGHELKSAALLYLGWGYCTYALSWQEAQLPGHGKCAHLEKMERTLERALELTIRSRDLCQLSGDQVDEATAGLLLALIQLDLSTRRRQLIGCGGGTSLASCLPPLDDAEEQCRHFLLSWQEMIQLADAPTALNEATIYVTLSYLVRASIQRATLARLSGDAQMASRERALATHLCQHTLDGLGEPSITWALLEVAVSLQEKRSIDGPALLPYLPEAEEDAPAFRPRLRGRVEVYWAAGEVAEEFGRAANSPDEAHDAYERADRCFQTALPLADLIVSSQEREPGYLVRRQQHYALLLEERRTSAPALLEETSRTLAVLLADGLPRVQNALLAEQLYLPDVGRQDR